jgi:hypothetical protein
MTYVCSVMLARSCQNLGLGHHDGGGVEEMAQVVEGRSSEL